MQRLLYSGGLTRCEWEKIIPSHPLAVVTTTQVYHKLCMYPAEKKQATLLQKFEHNAKANRSYNRGFTRVALLLLKYRLGSRKSSTVGEYVEISLACIADFMLPRLNLTNCLGKCIAAFKEPKVLYPTGNSAHNGLCKWSRQKPVLKRPREDPVPTATTLEIDPLTGTMLSMLRAWQTALETNISAAGKISKISKETWARTESGFAQHVATFLVRLGRRPTVGERAEKFNMFVFHRARLVGVCKDVLKRDPHTPPELLITSDEQWELILSYAWILSKLGHGRFSTFLFDEKSVLFYMRLV